MKRRVAAVAAIMLVSSLYLLSNPTTSDMLTRGLGVTSTDTALDRTSIASMAPLKDYSFSVDLVPGGSLAVSVRANPGNIDVLLMSAGNFSLWKSGEGSVSAYPQTRLGVSNYSFVFASEQAGTYSVALVSHSPDQTTQVLVHTVVTRPSMVETFLLPILLGLLGVVLMVYALRGRRTKVMEKESVAASANATSVLPSGGLCRHCGAVLAPGAPFCPSCSRSQA